MTIEAMDPAQEFDARVLARMKPVHEVTALGTSAVQQFYSGTTVFLTGGSGFLGKQLIEKLIRSTKVSKIYFLLRSKKGKSIQQRMAEMLQDPVYDLVREQQPDFADKLAPVSGDVAELRLGLSEDDWNTISEQVDVVFHLAATTRFDESLRVATLINIRGTRETLTFGKACKNLRSFVYVSTAYSHARTSRVNTEVSEKFYESPIAPNAMIQIAETVDEERLNDITPNLIKEWPNTYTFAKAVAEELVHNIGNDLPICVVRPAIVVGAKVEPIPGWIDMYWIYGASGVLLGFSLGVMHTMKAKDATVVPCIPVDYVNNVIIAAGWETARKLAVGDNDTMIYMVAPNVTKGKTWREMQNIISNEARNYQTPMAVLYPFAWNTDNSLLFYLLSWLFHLIPAYIADGISVMLGKKRSLIKNWPNTYTFAKSIAEELVHSIGNDLPICVVRPAIVLGANLEPNPGWVDKSCIFGASGVFLGITLGVMHTIKTKPNIVLASIPVDFVNNVIIAAGWETAKKQTAGDNDTKIYMVAPNARNPSTWREWGHILKENGQKYQTPMAVSYPFVWTTANSFLFWLLSWLLHLIPAYIADGISVMLGNQRRFVKLATRMYKMSTALCYFTCNQWNFDDQNTAALYSSLSKDDQDIFNFDLKKLDWQEYVITIGIGIRKYVLKDGLTGTVNAVRKLKVLKVLTFIILPLYFYCLFKILCFAVSVFTLF